MATTKGKKVKFNSSKALGSSLTLAALLAESAQEANAGTIFFTAGTDSRIVMNGADYTGVKMKETTGDANAVPTLVANSAEENVIYITTDSKSGRHLYMAATTGQSTKAWIELFPKVITGVDLNNSTASTPAAGDNSTAIATTAYVQGEINNKIAAANAMVFKGTVNAAADLPTTGYKSGWTYIVATAGTYAGAVCEVGDMIVANKDYASGTAANSDWSVIQANINGAVTGPSASTDGGLAAFSGTTGKVIKKAASKGSATQGIYLDANGVPQQMSYSLGKNVHANAALTDQSVTAETYHYTPEEASGAKLEASSAEKPNGFVKSILRDSKGHVTGIEVGEIPLDGYKTKQTAKTSPTASGNATAFIDTISQDADGVVTATKKNIPTASASATGLLSSTDYNTIMGSLTWE